MKSFVIRLTAISAIVISMAAQFFANAQAPESRPIRSIYSIETGSATAFDTYLSPLRYTGENIYFSAKWIKAMPFSPKKWVMQFDTQIGSSIMKNPIGSATMYDFDFLFAYGMNRRFKVGSKLQFTGGAYVSIDGGALYLPRNGNNPASGRATIGIGVKGSVAYPIKIGKLPILLTDEVSIPSFNVFFSPEYGEPYYEISLGNRKGLAHTGWWGNHFGIDNLLTADIDFGSTALRIGYRFDLSSSWICDINTRRVRHSIVIGIIPGSIGLRNKKSNIINPIYLQ